MTDVVMWWVLIQRVADVLTVWFVGWNVPTSLYFTIMTSPWRWPEYRSKHFGESIVNELRHKYWSVFVGYWYIFDIVVTMIDETGL
jgi:hypothetical protein